MAIFDVVRIAVRWALQVISGDPVVWDRHLSISQTQENQSREWGYASGKWSGSPRILMASGHGYGNVGDEAQCGACISRWRKIAPSCRITLFSPNPDYTESLHGERCVWAPRVAWFRANTSSFYFSGGKRFAYYFRYTEIRLLISAHFLRRGIPFLFCNPREAGILSELQQHNLLHISGGGFLTGKTRSRLWENCLLMRLCQILDVPYILTGHNIGVFQSKRDRQLAYKGLKAARYIGLRDRGISEKEIAAIGVRGSHVESTCDDALLCPRLDEESVRDYLFAAGADVNCPWAAVNFHRWGQDLVDQAEIESRFATICDQMIEKLGLQLVFIAMTPSDVAPELAVIAKMKHKAVMAPYSPDYKVVRGIIADSKMVFTMKHHPIVFAQGEGVPVVAVSLDDYYLHKNKGALDNTGHSRFLIDQKLFWSTGVFQVIQDCFEQKSQISCEQLAWVNLMKAFELKPYMAAVDFLKK